MRKIGLILLLAFAPGPAAAQDGVIKNLSAEEFEKIIKEDLKKDFVKAELPDGHLYTLKDTPFLVLYSSEKFVMFFVKHDAKDVTLEKINAWNVDAVYSRAYLLKNEIRFEVAFTYVGGVTRANVKEYFDKTEKEWKDFSAKFLGK